MFGEQALPAFLPFLKSSLGVELENERPVKGEVEIPLPNLHHAFIEDLGVQNISRRSFWRNERVLHSHGHTFQEVFALRNGHLQRYIDMVVYPMTTEHVENLVTLANKHDVVLVPYGGGTNVTQSLMLPLEEKRMIVSVDMARMSSIKWVDKENNLACVGAGIIGSDLERDLKQYGVISGHEPDSMEFSTLGGWISTRASGMKKNTYGNIEDIVQNITLVTSKGTYSKVATWPRASNGPDLNHLVMGSEGNFGIITEAVIKVKTLPEVRIFDSILFYHWESGVQFMHAVSKTNAYPTSCRLVDNEQFKFGSTLKPEVSSKWEAFVESAKKFFVLNIKGYDANTLTACTLLFEGPKD
jgi:alkyldihydroxyacetonephosphate synthase